MLQTFSFQSMFRDIRPSDVQKIARRQVCCVTGKQIKPEDWLAIVVDGGTRKFCLSDCVNGRRACVPTRELVETMVPGFSNLKLKTVDRYSSGTRKKSGTNVMAGL